MRHDTLDPFAPDVATPTSRQVSPETGKHQRSVTPQEPFGEDRSYDSAPTGTFSKARSQLDAVTTKARRWFTTAQREAAPAVKKIGPGLTNARDVITREAKEHPVRTAAAAMGIGWLLGRGLPKVFALAGIYGLTRLAKRI